jgi:hypothetical protein
LEDSLKKDRSQIKDLKDSQQEDKAQIKDLEKLLQRRRRSG